MKRRHFLGLLGVGGVGALAASCCGLRSFIRPKPRGPLPEGARSLLMTAWTGIDPSRQLDSHVHLVGLGAGGTGCYANARMRQALRHPIRRIQFETYELAGGIEDESRADQQYVETLVGLIRSQPIHGRCLLLAFDETYDESGHRLPEASEFFTPNRYVLEVAREHPDCFLPAASVHPYRPDAVDELSKSVEGGAVCVKWLPNAQRFDPLSPRCDRFYERMAQLKIPILSHAGEEAAVDSDEFQKLGNPLRLRRALDHGVKVIVAHCASLGSNPDLDAPAQPQTSNLELFLRLMAEPRYEGLLFADISALPQINRCESGLREVLARTDLHERLINGSDYPLPAIHFLVRTSKLETLGLITAGERRALDELHDHNPLAFDFAVKRCVKHKLPDGTVARFSDSVFMIRRELFG